MTVLIIMISLTIMIIMMTMMDMIWPWSWSDQTNHDHYLDHYHREYHEIAMRSENPDTRKPWQALAVGPIKPSPSWRRSWLTWINLEKASPISLHMSWWKEYSWSGLRGLIPPCSTRSSSWVCSPQHCRQRVRGRSRSKWNRSRLDHWFQTRKPLVGGDSLLLGSRYYWLHRWTVLTQTYPTEEPCHPGGVSLCLTFFQVEQVIITWLSQCDLCCLNVGGGHFPKV